MVPEKKIVCPDCEAEEQGIDRRRFLRLTAVSAATGALGLGSVPRTAAAPAPKSPDETVVKTLYDKLTEKQKKAICFDWDHMDRERGLLRTHVSNNWQITKPHVASDFFTKEQQTLILDIFKNVFNPDWHKRL